VSLRMELNATRKANRLGPELTAHRLAALAISTHLAGINPNGVGTVALKSLKGVGVPRGSRRIGIPFVVDVLFGVLVPELVVVFSVLESSQEAAAAAGAV